ncbi:hypothetical protein [Streptomyces sp. NPDC005336]|uniref:hypothetical protein n=1 Tax=unclassified Streptomyces TaxID=2593676 RepID=UPI0033BE6242
MPMKSWGHRERLVGLCWFGALVALCGVAATVSGATTGPGLALVGTVLGCWEAIGLWLWSAYATGSRDSSRGRR